MEVCVEMKEPDLSMGVRERRSTSPPSSPSVSASSSRISKDDGGNDDDVEEGGKVKSRRRLVEENNENGASDSDGTTDNSEEEETSTEKQQQHQDVEDGRGGEKEGNEEERGSRIGDKKLGSRLRFKDESHDSDLGSIHKSPSGGGGGSRLGSSSSSIFSHGFWPAVGDFLLSTFFGLIYPVTLLVGSVIESHLFSWIYFLAFIAYIIWSPHPALHVRKNCTKINVIIICLFSTLHVMSHVGYAYFIPNPTTPPGVCFFDASPLDEVCVTPTYITIECLTGVQSLDYVDISVGIVLIAESLLAIFLLLIRHVFDTNEPPSLYTIVVSRRTKGEIHAFACLVFLLFAGCGFGSISTFVYFVAYLLSILSFAALPSAQSEFGAIAPMVGERGVDRTYFPKERASAIIEASWHIGMLYTALHLIVGYINSAAPDLFLCALPSDALWVIEIFIGSLRFRGGTTTEIIEYSWPYYVSYGSIAALFILYGQKCRTLAEHSALKNANVILDDRSFEEEGGEGPKETNSFVSFIGTYNWKLGMLVDVITSIYYPSLLSLIMLVLACIATIAPGEFIVPWLPTIVFYSFCYSTLQYVVNLPILFDWVKGEAIDEIGLGAITPFLLYFALKSLSMFLYASYWRYRDYYSMRTNASQNQVKSPSVSVSSVPSSPQHSSKNYNTFSENRPRNDSVLSDNSAQDSSSEDEDGFKFIGHDYRKKMNEAAAQVKKQLQHAVRSFNLICTMSFVFLVRQSYLMSLAGVYLCSLGTANLLSAGYMVIFIVFLIWSKVAHQCWIFLLIYTEVVILLQYAWQTDLTLGLDDDLAAQLLGLQHYNPIVGWSTGLFWYLIIWVFSIGQMYINKKLNRGLMWKYKSKKKVIPKLQRTDTVTELKLHPVMYAFTDWFEAFLRGYGPTIGYFLITGLTYAEPFNIIRVTLLGLVCICCVFHYITKNEAKFCRPIWLIIQIIAAVSLLLRYLYQLPWINTLIAPNYHNQYLTLPELGLVPYQGFAETFKGLTGGATTLVISVLVNWTYSESKKVESKSSVSLQERPLLRPSSTDEDESGVRSPPSSLTSQQVGVALFGEKESKLGVLKGGLLIKSKAADSADSATIKSQAGVSFGGLGGRNEVKKGGLSAKFLETMNSLRLLVVRFLILHSWKMSTLGIFIVAVINLSVMNIILGRGRVPLCLYLHPVLFSYTILLPVLVIGVALCNCFKKGLNRFGIILLIYSIVGAMANLVIRFQYVQGQLYHIRYLVTCIGLTFDFDDHTEDIYNWLSYMIVVALLLMQRVASRWLSEGHFEGSIKPNIKTGEPCSLFLIDEEKLKSEDVGLGVLWEKTLWYLSNLYQIFGFEIFLLLMVIDVFVRNTVLGIVYYLFVGVCLIVRREKILRGILGISLYLQIVLVCQYVMVLTSKPEWEQAGYNLPWSSGSSSGSISDTSEASFSWIGLCCYQTRYEIIADCILAIGAACLVFQKKQIVLIEDEQLLKRDFTIKPRNFIATLKFYFYCTSTTWILILTFVFGTWNPCLLSLGYVVFSLICLYKGDLIFRVSYDVWKWVRFYNYAVLFVEIIYQIPAIPPPTYIEDYSGSGSDMAIAATPRLLSTSFESIVGLNKVDMYTAFTPDGVLFDVIIFVLLACQRELYATREFALVRQFVLKEWTSAKSTALQHYKKTKAIEVEELHQIELESAARNKRFETLKKERQIEQQNRETLESIFRVGLAPPTSSPSIPSLGLGGELRPLLSPRGGGFTPRRETDSFTAGSPGTTPLMASTSSYNAGEATDTSPSLPPPSQGPSSVPSLSLYPLTLSTANVGRTTANIEKPSPAGAPKASKDAKSQFQQEGKLFEEGEGFLEALLLEMNTEGYMKRIWNNIIASIVGPMDALEQEFRKTQMLRNLGRWLGHHTEGLCYIAFVLNNLFYSNLISVVYPISAFIYAAIHFPLPPKNYWRYITVYNCITIAAKFCYQISCFCICGNGSIYGSASWSFGCDNPDKLSQCASTDTNDNLELSAPYVVGIYTISPKHFFSGGIALDLLVLSMLLIHRYMLRKLGKWNLLKDIERKEMRRHERRRRKEEKKKATTLLKDEMKERLLGGRRKTSDSQQLLPQMVAVTHTMEEEREKLEALKEDIEIVLDDSEEEEEGEKLSRVHRRRRGGTEVSLDEEEKGYILEDEKHYSMDSSTSFSNLPYPDDPSLEASSLSSEENKSGYVGMAWAGISGYFSNLCGNTNPTKDFYTEVFLIELLCFFYLVVSPSDFIGDAATSNSDISITTLISQNQIPRSLFLLILSQFALIVIERIVYLYRSLKIKIAMHYTLVILLNILLCFYLPQLNQTAFYNTPTLMIFYLLKCLYFWFSCLQIYYGFPVVVQNRWLTSHPTFIRRYVFVAYRSLPFVYELRTLLDWTIEDTSLGFFDWLKVEDIYSQVFLNKTQVEWNKRFPRKSGDKQSLLMKILLGAFLFTILIIVVWFPLFLMSSANPSNTPNPAISASLAIGLQGWEPFYQMTTQPVGGLPTESITRLRNLFPSPSSCENFTACLQQVDLLPFSEIPWVITPPALTLLQQKLAASSVLNLYVTYTFSRNTSLTANNLPISDTTYLALNASTMLQFQQIVNPDTAADSIILPLFIPRVLNILPLNSVPPIYYPPAASNQATQKIGIKLSLNRTVMQETVSEGEKTTTIQDYTAYWNIASLAEDPISLSNETVSIYVISPSVPTGLVASIASAGIVGLYIGVVLSVGRFLRMAVSNIQMRVPYEDMPECDELLQMCQDIFLARQLGDMDLERELYEELIEVYRSQERIIERTRPKIKKTKEQ